jgi:16S rRNA (guanine527-N7)-methyltransferase
VVDFSTKPKNLCYIRSGAGFPGIPVKIHLSRIYGFIIIETTMKKNALFKSCLDRKCWSLENVEIIKGRAEEVIVRFREFFPVVTARAVARLPMLLEFALPYAEVGGFFLSHERFSFLQ